MDRDRPNIDRVTLGDLTNQLGKRGFSLISRSSASKSSVDGAKHLKKENDSPLAKRTPVVSRNSQLEVLGGKCPKVVNVDQSLPLLKGGKTYRLLSRGNADSATDSNPKTGNQLSSAEGSLGLLGSGNNPFQDVVERGCVNSQTLLEIGGASQDPELKDDPQATQQTEPLLETLGSQTASTDGMDSGLTGMPSTECLQSAGSRLTELQATKPFELQRCVWLKSDAATNAVADADSLKSCSCSFCMKAAHIWSELHYLDVKGRLSVLMKSKKEASNLERLFSVEDGNSMARGQEGSSHSSLNLENDLMNRSKSMFAYMEETFGKECSQLETELSSLKDIREGFKMNLGPTVEMPQDAEQCGSDASLCKKKT